MSSTTKTCSKCNETKNVSEFYSRGATCKECAKLRQREKNKELSTKNLIDEPKTCNKCNETKSSLLFRANRKHCKDCERAHGRNYRQSEVGKEKSKQWIAENEERHKELKANNYQKNKEKINKKYNERYNNDEAFNAERKMRCKMAKYIAHQQSKTYNNTVVTFVRSWIEFCFSKDMNWDNYGDEWVFDHVIPIFYYDLNNKTELKKCFDWYNLTPVTKKYNLKKNKYINKEQLDEHIKKLNSFIKTQKEYDKERFEEFMTFVNNEFEC